MSESRRGLVHVYTGDGKGKTCAALGMALRAAGHGWRTYVGQFMKGQDYGELKAAQMLDGLLTIEQYGKPTFVHVGQVTPEDVQMVNEGLALVLGALQSGEYQMVVLDEINVALYFGLLAARDVLSVIDAKPEGVELVLTGRRVPEEILARADYVTVMREVKHPYQHGVLARKGVEF
ncbi:MAG: cob(I)yrinic acid a,c-diamide adenosyltransferase [Chloroflexi bacterium]|nr:cob(I)yrinic acid a,c-diamide adenosyltransferase [Chloroflexota bacterium]